MSLRKKLILWFVFLSTFGFAGGIYFLLFLVVPFEQLLVDKGLSQMEIDNILSYVVYGWVVFGFLISFLYYFIIVNKKRLFWTYFLVIFTVINAGLALYLFLNTNTAIVTGVRGEEQQIHERFTFGPYPDINRMKALKEEGYDGIITLLSTTLERELLATEIENGEIVGIDIYSFPMLPWIGDNKEAIQDVKDLVNNDDSKRYYIHCYLGKHRADIIKQIILTELGQEIVTKEQLYPTLFERGEIFTSNNNNIILGPYPTDEEWLFLIRNGIEEIISFLPDDSSFLDREKAVIDEYDLAFTHIPIDSDEEIAFETLVEVNKYIDNLNHKVYLHGFNSKGIVLSLELFLRKNIEPLNTYLVPSNFENGKTYKVGKWMILGPKPTVKELTTLKKSGIDSIIYITDKRKYSELPKIVRDMGLSYQELYTDNINLKNLYGISKEIKGINSTAYIYSINDNIILPLANMLQGSIYGVDKSLDNLNLENGNVKFARRRDDILIGPYLNKNEWEQLIILNGIESVIAINVPSLYSEEILDDQKKLAEEYGVIYSEIDMFEGYEGILLERLLRDRKTTYIIVPMQIQDIIFIMLKGD